MNAAVPADRLTVLHVDLDAFYASVEQLDRPELRGRPVVGGGLGGRGVVCAASYEARPFGVRSAMPMAVARRLCPQAAFLPVRMERYAAVANQIRDILLSFTPLVEPLSLDEAFLDLRGCVAAGAAPEAARRIKERVRAETGLAASVGVAANKFLAKLAGDLGKPDGLLVVRPEEADAFLAPLPVGRLWGVGAAGERRLHALGLRTVGQVAALPERALEGHLGAAGRQLWLLARGQDDRPVVPDREARSVSVETTFEDDVGDRGVLRAWLLGLVDELGSRLRQRGVRAGAVELKARSADFRTATRRRSLAEPTDVTDALWRAAAGLLAEALPEGLLPLRLLGVGATALTRSAVEQGDLFDGGRRRRGGALDRAVDASRARFGGASIRRGGSLRREGAGPGGEAEG
jgi:DNA polymerase-4